MVVSDAFGLFHTADAGGTWHLTCAESYRADSFGTTHTPVTVIPGGRILAANAFHGLYLSTADVCDWQGLDDFSDQSVPDVKSASNGDVFALALSAFDGGARSAAVWRSTDGAASWTRMGAPPVVFSAASLAVAPSDPQRLYVVARADPDGSAVFYRSPDAGATWTEVSHPDAADGVLRLRVVDPTDPDGVYLQLDRPLGNSGPNGPPDEILYSGDGGQSWATVYRGASDLPGLAVSPDGAHVVIGGPLDGLWRAECSRVGQEGASAFAQILTRPIWALDWTENGLFAGQDDFAKTDAAPRFTLGVSQDDGESFEPFLVVCDVEENECPSSTTAGSVCPDLYSRVGGFEANVRDNVRCTGPPPPDPGPAEPPARSKRGSGGCGCRQAAGDAPARVPWMLALAAAACATRRKSTPRSTCTRPPRSSAPPAE